MPTEDAGKQGFILEGLGLAIGIQWVIFYFKKVRVLPRRGKT